jgi:hypothetical protein
MLAIIISEILVNIFFEMPASIFFAMLAIWFFEMLAIDFSNASNYNLLKAGIIIYEMLAGIISKC